VLECPISRHNKSEQLVVVHNPSALDSPGFAQVKLPHPYYKAQLWNSTAQRFEALKSDILE